MKPNERHYWRDLEPESLESNLRSLPEVKAPENLEAKLSASIPNKPVKVKRAGQGHWSLVWPLGAAAAAVVLIFSLTFVSDGIYTCPRGSVNPNEIISELNDACCAMIDNNSGSPDINCASFGLAR